MVDVFETNEPELAHEVMSSAYGRLRLDVTGERHYLRITQGEVGQVALHHVTFGMRFRAEFDPLGVIPIGRTAGGTVAYSCGGVGITGHCPGEVLIAAQPDREFTSMVDSHDGDWAFLPPRLLEQVAASAPSRGTEPIRFTGYEPISPAGATRWSRAYDHANEMMTVLETESAPALAEQTGRLLAAVALTVFPNNALHDPTIEDRHDAHSITLRRAIAFIDDNAERDISVADIASAAGVTIRAVDLAFRRHHNTTPAAYLRQVRLYQAHRELQAADPASTTVRRIALRWGFTNSAHFANAYRTDFGQPPGQTLRG